jgi:hypothetical protein
MIIMKNYNYIVNIYAEDEITFRTNDVRGALDTFLTHGGQGLHCDLLDGYTGEVLAIVNCPDCEDYATDEIMLMTEGMFFELLEGEEIAPEIGEDDPEPVDESDLVSRVMEKVIKDLGLDSSLPLSFIKLGGMPS